MREMAKMLRNGAKMLSISCPECGTPLFELKTGEIFCSKCNKEIKILNEGENVNQFTIYSNLEKTIFDKIQLLEKKLETEEDINKISTIAETLILLINILKKINEHKESNS
jgi:UPF0148 protein